ncbi:MAG: DMT family transporter [Litoreibacter sp.]|nr:DMT family transporter [Litoreibacter sp.]
MTAQKSLSQRAWAELMLLSLIWGASFVSIKIALDEVPVFTSVAHRVFWASLVLWIYVLVRGIRIPRSASIWGAFLVMGLLNNAIPFSLMAWGQLHIESGLTSILNAATAIFGVLVAALLFSDERLTPNRLAGVVIGFLGVATAIGLENLARVDLRSVAQLAVLGGTISYAFAGAWARVTLSGLPPQIAAAGMLSASSLIMIPLAYAIDGAPAFDLSARTITAIGYYAVIATAGAYLLYYRVLSMAGSGNLMLCTLMVAPVAIVLGALLLGEALDPRAYLGFGLLAIGLLILDGRILRILRPTP